MDLKVYQKEEVAQPDGNLSIIVPNIIDIIPSIEIINGEEVLTGASVLDSDSRELAEQQSALATIWQRGLDPLALTEGIRWSEAILEEINPIQLMEEIQTAVASVSSSVVVEFNTVTDGKGNSFLSYTLRSLV